MTRSALISRAVLCGAAFTMLLGCATAFAQGSTGGSIGNDNKSLSGSSESSRSTAPARRAKPERAERRTAPRRDEARPAVRRADGGSGVGNGIAKFDGTWSVTSVGITCPDTLTISATVSNGRVTSQYDTGSISANGATSSVGNYGGITVTSQGRTTATNGSGTFQRSDGCRGRWTSFKQ